MATAFHSKADVDAALRSGNYRRQSITKTAPVVEPPQQNSEAVEPEEAKEPPKPDSIDVNTAPLATLTQIKGIGLAKGKELIEKRPYQTAEDLIAVTEAVDWLKLVENDDIWFG